MVTTMLIRNMPMVRRIARITVIWDLMFFDLISTYVEDGGGTICPASGDAYCITSKPILAIASFIVWISTFPSNDASPCARSIRTLEIPFMASSAFLVEPAQCGQLMPLIFIVVMGLLLAVFPFTGVRSFLNIVTKN
jgi:hypothetical protein